MGAARLAVRGRVLVVDDSDAFVRAAASILSKAVELRLVGVAFSGEEAVHLVPDLDPDLIVLDIQMPGIDGIETASIIREQSPKTVIVLVSSEPAGYEAAANLVGAAAILNKADLRADMLDALWLKHLPRE